MMAKDSKRYIRNGDIDGSSPKQSPGGPVPPKFQKLFKPSTHDFKTQASNN
jgi:hypothetical protein